MTSSEFGRGGSVDVDVVVVGAGILGINQLYCCRAAGFSVRLLEAGDGVGGTWFWNRYPQARFDSESYTYGYFFSQELFEEWEWSEQFAGQPEIERYMNHVVDRFGLRDSIQFGARVTSAVYDEESGTWAVRAGDGSELRARFLIAATGVLSMPFYPALPGLEDFRGESYHTGLWPATPVDFIGKRAAVVGVGSSGVQVVPAIADEVASLTVYQRTANWCTPLNNRPVTAAEQAELKAGFETIRQMLYTSTTGHPYMAAERATFEDSAAGRAAFYEKMWNAPGLAKLLANYSDMRTDSAANAEWCAFIAAKIREIVHDPATAEKLIPNDHGFGEIRPPCGTGYYEAYNKPNVSLVDLKATPILRVTETGIETAEGERELDIIVWATGFDFGRALHRMGIRGRDGLALEQHWADGPSTFMGIQTHGFPNLFFPGGPHGAAGNNPRYGEDQVDFITDTLVYMRDRNYDIVEVSQAAEDGWNHTMDTLPKLHSTKSYFYGSNIPGKPVRYLLNPGGRPTMREAMTHVLDNDYDAYHFTKIPTTAEHTT